MVLKKIPKEKRMVNLLFDEMSVQPSFIYDPTLDKITGFEDFGAEKSTRFADHALVFMIKGVKGKIKQPICFTFCQSTTKKQTLKNLVITLIRQLRDAGFVVVATVCDQCTTNVSTIKPSNKKQKLNIFKKE